MMITLIYFILVLSLVDMIFLTKAIVSSPVTWEQLGHRAHLPEENSDNRASHLRSWCACSDQRKYWNEYLLYLQSFSLRKQIYTYYMKWYSFCS